MTNDAPTLGPLQLSAARRIRVGVTLDGGSHVVRIDHATTAQDASAPVHASRLWIPAATAAEGESAETPPRPRRRRTWVRASGRDEDGSRTSPYTEPVSLVVPAAPGLQDVALQLDEAGALAIWTPHGATAAVRARWAVHLSEADGQLSDPLELPAGAEAFAVPRRVAMGEAATVELVPDDAGELRTLEGFRVVDGNDEQPRAQEPRVGDTVELLEVRELVTGTAAAPLNWLFSQLGHPLRTSDHRVALESGLRPDPQWLRDGTGVVLRASDLTPMRSTP